MGFTSLNSFLDSIRIRINESVFYKESVIPVLLNQAVRTLCQKGERRVALFRE
jgi:hypothetical protein